MQNKKLLLRTDIKYPEQAANKTQTHDQNAAMAGMLACGRPPFIKKNQNLVTFLTSFQLFANIGPGSRDSATIMFSSIL